VKTSENGLYECNVMHHRLTPKEHHFAYRIFYFWLDLDSLDATAKRLWFFSRNRFNLYSFYDKDHLDKGAVDTKANIIRYLAENDITFPEGGSIKLLTLCRIGGYIFNPVCFFYCFDALGEPLCVVAQVTNTYHEMKPYLISDQDDKGRFRLLTPKHFYVSPFSDLELFFDFKLTVPADHFIIHIDDREENKPVLLSKLSGIRVPLTDAKLLWFAVKYPVMTLRVIFLIHWHALRLWMKGLPVHAKAANRDQQRGVYRPHPSIATKP
jgi:DUF1365 family protein